MVFVGLLILVALSIRRWGADSRPGLGDGRTDRVERWSPL
jgi:hypothetical protein